MLRTLTLAGALLSGSLATAAPLVQTMHFHGTDAAELFGLYMTGDGQQRITGLPARYVNAKGETVDKPVVGDRLFAFCFTPDKCALDATVKSIQENPGQYTVVMSWRNAGWLSAVDSGDYTVKDGGAPDSILVLTFRDTLSGAQIELVQVNVPDYKVLIPNPDGTKESGSLSSIVNTHWHTLYWDGFRRLVSR